MNKEIFNGLMPELTKQNFARTAGGAVLFGSSLIPGNINAQESKMTFESSDSSHVLDIEGQMENNPPELEGFKIESQQEEEEEVGAVQEYQNKDKEYKSFIPGYASEDHPSLLEKIQKGDYEITEDYMKDQVTDLKEHKEEIIATPTPTPTPTPVPPTPTPVPPMPTPVPPTPIPQQESESSNSYVACEDRSDRYDWKSYAIAAGFPPSVVHGEMENVVQKESGGDLCAVNPTSGATCWVQIHPGGSEYLDPMTCMREGYRKWKSDGGSFQTHWYNHW